MAREQKKPKLSMFDRYVIYRDEKWAGRDLVAREVAEDLLAMGSGGSEDPPFFSEHWIARALLNQAILLVLEFEKRIRRKGKATERVDVLRAAMPEVHTWDEGGGTATMAPPKLQHVQREVQEVTAEQWIRRLEKAKQESEGQRQELVRLWGVMKKELNPAERKKVEKHFRADHLFQTFLNIEGIEEE